MLKPFSAMILAAGFGKRMLPLTDKIPKPLLKVNNTPLLKNVIDFLFKIGCTKIIINTHYKHHIIYDFIDEFYNFSNISILHEEKILDTGGGVKNAISLFDDENILVTNADIYWKKENEEDVINLINDFKSKEGCRLLLVDQEKAHGFINKVGDFSLINNEVRRWKIGDKIIYYSGLQIISLNIFKDFSLRKFSFNDVWNNQITKNSLYGNIMSSHLYHVGEIKGLKEAINLGT
jgi:MurNAc alpha-1-phosphate uridylyltransferase